MTDKKQCTCPLEESIIKKGFHLAACGATPDTEGVKKDGCCCHKWQCDELAASVHNCEHCKPLPSPSDKKNKFETYIDKELERNPDLKIKLAVEEACLSLKQSFIDMLKDVEKNGHGGGNWRRLLILAIAKAEKL